MAKRSNAELERVCSHTIRALWRARDALEKLEALHMHIEPVEDEYEPRCLTCEIVREGLRD